MPIPEPSPDAPLGDGGGVPTVDRPDTPEQAPPPSSAGDTSALRRRFGRPRLPRSRRGIAALLLVLAGFGAALTFGASAAIGWTETADFCGRCHQMGPELA